MRCEEYSVQRGQTTLFITHIQARLQAQKYQILNKANTFNSVSESVEFSDN